MGKEQKSEDCIRYKAKYRGHNLYIIVGEKAIHLNMANKDEFLTLDGLSLVERLYTELLAFDYDLEYLAGLAWECSSRADSLPRLIHNAIMYYLDTIQRKNLVEKV